MPTTTLPHVFRNGGCWPADMAAYVKVRAWTSTRPTPFGSLVETEAVAGTLAEGEQQLAAG